MNMQCTRNRLFHSASELENIFNQVFGAATGGEKQFVPPSDLVETDTHYHITLELPGVKLEDISVEFVDDLLQVSGEKKSACDETAKACHCSERRGGAFKRSFRFPSDVDAEKIDARLENGLLKITLPKAVQVLPRKVEVKVGG